MLGGKNPNSLYIPISDLESETLERLVQSGLSLTIKGHGSTSVLRFVVGDKRFQISTAFQFMVEKATYVHFMDLELWHSSGRLIHSERLPTLYGNLNSPSPILILPGDCLDIVWDISLERLDMQLVRSICPGAIGRTSRLDGDLGYTNEQQRLASLVYKGEAYVRQLARRELELAERLSERNG